MIDMHEFQEAGAPYRRGLGIDGTAGDAQDVSHAYAEDAQFPAICIVCGLSASYSKHQAE